MSTLVLNLTGLFYLHVHVYTIYKFALRFAEIMLTFNLFFVIYIINHIFLE